MSDEDQGGWQLTESDPGVFTELLRTLGVPLVVDDLYSLDEASLAQLQPVHALIFLFKWISTPSTVSGAPLHGGAPAPDFAGFFAHQVVNNACATLAVLNALGNIHPLTAGPDLASLFDFTQSLDPSTRGLALTSADWLRAAHNALSPPAVVSLDELGLKAGKEDAYHFVVYVPLHGRVWELDGLKAHAIDHGAYEEKGEGWLKVARSVVESRISTYPDGALEFNLQALHDDPIPQLEQRLAELQSAGANSFGGEAAELVVRLSTEKEKRERWAFENSLRRHNHLGLVHAALLALAKAGKLGPTMHLAREKMRERVAKARERGEDPTDD